MRIISSLILVAFFFVQEVSAQFNFHRTYPVSGRQEIALGLTQTTGGYYAYNGVIDFAGNFSALNVTKFDPKGESTWSRDITIEEDWRYVLDGEIVGLRDDSLAISIILDPTLGQENQHVIIKLDPQGDVVWTKGFGGFEEYEFDNVNYPITITSREDFTLLGATTYSLEGGENGVNCFSLDDNGDANWANRVLLTDSMGVNARPLAFGSSMVEDSSLLIGGWTTDLGFNFADGLLMKLDSIGDPLWAKNYIDSLGGFNVGNDVLMLSDTSYLLAGTNQNLQGIVNGFVLKTDRDGDLLWSKQIVLGGLGVQTFLNHVTEVESGNIVASGEVVVFVNNMVQSSNAFKIKLDPDGELIWSKLYPRTLGLNFNVGELESIAEDGSAYWGTYLTEVGTLAAHLIVADSLGNAGGSMAPELEQCAQMLPDSIIFDWPTGQREYELTTVADTAIVDYMAESVARAIGFDIPTITLVDTAFCPNDPIFVIEDAFVEGADSYLWNTEETTPSIEVEEEGMPIVEVTINDERGCFTLCDTATISVLDSTMVALQIDDSSWCTDRTIRVAAFPSGGLAPYSIDWSTGDTVPQIAVQIDSGGMTSLSVDVLDQCGILATQALDLSAPNIEAADYIFAWNIDRYCAEGVIELQLFGGIFNNIMWFDGLGNPLLELQGPNPIVTEFGTYAFSAVDTCGFIIADQITIPNGLPQPQEINIDFDVDRACATGELQLELNGPVADGLSNVRWFDAAGNEIGNNLNVIVPDYGTYSVLAIDACQFEIGDEITIGLDDLPTTNIILIADDTISCETGLLRIRIEDPTGLSNIVWSSGQTNQAEIFVDDFDSEYIVTADFCQQNYTSNAVSPNINTENFVRWPNALYPGLRNMSMDEDLESNKFFGPFIICPSAVSNYELRIYNQYGNLMFETNDPEELWDGTKDGDPAPGDVYVWYSTYEVSSITEEINGTATLIR